MDWGCEEVLNNIVESGVENYINFVRSVHITPSAHK